MPAEPWDEIPDVVTIWRVEPQRWEWRRHHITSGWNGAGSGPWTTLAHALLLMADADPSIGMYVHRIVLRLLDGRMLREAS